MNSINLKTYYRIFQQGILDLKWVIEYETFQTKNMKRIRE